MLSRIAAAVCILTLVFPALALEKQERIIAGSPSDSMEVRHLVLKGTNEEIGRALAEIARDRYQVQPQAARDAVRARAQRRFMERNFPILYDRMRGVAAAYGHRLDDDAWDHSSLAFTELRAACSIVHLPPSSTTTGKSVVSRDYDFSTGSLSFGFLAPGMLHPTARPYLVELHPDRGYASIAMVAYDLLSGVLDGMNSEGLVVTMAMDDELFSDPASKLEPTIGPAPGLGVLQMMRLLLDTCANVDEAKEALLMTKQYYEYVPVHFLIADRSGKSFVWEYSQAHNKEYIIESPNEPLVMTNFSLNRHLDQDRPPSAEQAKSVCRRYSFLSAQLASAGTVSEEFLQRTHAKVDAQRPASADTSRPPERTFWHALYFPEDRRVKFSFYLRDEPRITRTEYLEFSLDASTTPSAAAAAQPAPAPVPVKGTSINLDKVDDPASYLRGLGNLREITEITAMNARMDDAAVQLLAGSPKLARLNLFGAGIGDASMKVMRTLPALRVLVIGGTKVTDAGLADVGTLTQLEELNLKATNITDAGIAHLATLTRLEILNLAETPITDAGLAHLAKLRGITGLILRSTKVTDAGLTHLRSMGRLTKLDARKTAVTDAGVKEAKKFLPFWASVQR